jgi:hypothetical protein
MTKLRESQTRMTNGRNLIPLPPTRGRARSFPSSTKEYLFGVVELVALRRVAPRAAAQRFPANQALRPSRSAAARGGVVAARQPLPLNRYEGRRRRCPGRVAELLPIKAQLPGQTREIFARRGIARNDFRAALFRPRIRLMARPRRSSSALWGRITARGNSPGSSENRNIARRLSPDIRDIRASDFSPHSSFVTFNDLSWPDNGPHSRAACREQKWSPSSPPPPPRE